VGVATARSPMDINGLPKLYQDENYLVWDNRADQVISLCIPARRLVLEFSYKEWQAIRSIVAGIELPYAPTEEYIVLYRGDIDLFTMDDGFVRWIIGDRMIVVILHMEDWGKFKAMMAKAGGPTPWTVI